MKAETDRLVADMEALPEYRGWQFTYEYPGYFCYSHPSNSFSVFCTPDWEGDETLPIQVQVADGRSCEEYDARFPLPREGRSAQQIFELVRPTLDKILTVLTYAHVEAWCEKHDNESTEGWLTLLLDGTCSVDEMRAAVLEGRQPARKGDPS